LLRQIEPGSNPKKILERGGSQETDKAIPDPGRDLLPAALDSIDMVGALTRLGNNKALYRRMLFMFHAEHEQDVPAIRTALKDNDLELARRLAHNLKGLAGSVGAEELRTVSKDLELAIAKGNEPLYDETLAQVEQKLAVVMASIATLTHQA
jgi:two-component system sensor histidine kinase/response regulator